jgi:hypothetical protein
MSTELTEVQLRNFFFLLARFVCFFFILICSLLVGRSLQRHVVCRDLRVQMMECWPYSFLRVAAKPFHVVKSMAYHA